MRVNRKKIAFILGTIILSTLIIAVNRHFTGNGNKQDTQDPGHDQIWEKIQESNDQFHHYRNSAEPHLCLSVGGASFHKEGDSVKVSNCDTVDSEWYTEGTDNSTSVNGKRYQLYKIKNKFSHLCLGVRNFDSHHPGTEAEVYQCDGRDSQWFFYPIEGKQVQIRNSVSQYCLDVPGIDNYQIGSKLQVYDCQRG